jgi:type I restriction enzyme S subunit
MAKRNYSELKVAAARTALFNNIKNVIEEINIHDVLKLSSGENLPTHKMIDGNYPVFGGGGSTNLTHNNFNVDFETLAVGRVGARCGCVFKVPKESWITDNALYALTFDKRFKLEFLIQYLSYVDLNQYANRAAQPVISLKRISSINFPLIDEGRQNAFIEIIKDVENGKTYFGEEYSELNNALKSVDSINQLQSELKNQLTHLENLNQAILQEAVQGKLVKQDKKDEPASELLKRIKAEKAKSSKKEKPLPPIKPEEIPFEIPENWVWAKLNEICDNITDGTHQTPTYFKSGYIFLSSKNVTSGKIDWNEIKYIDEKQHLEMHKRVAPRLNDILLAKNGTTGVAALVDRDVTFDIYVSLALLRPLVGIYPNYLLHFVNSSTAKLQFNKRLRGIGVPNLHLNEIREVLIPIPPFEEQKRIVVEIEKQLAKTKQLKEHIIANQQATEQLLKALLHQAFEVKEMEEV